MVTFFVLVLLGLVLVFAGLELRARYRAEVVIGSEEWNAYQVRLREYVDASRGGKDERKREAYERRLEAGAARGVFADEEERRQARVLALHKNIYRDRDDAELAELRRVRQDETTL